VKKLEKELSVKDKEIEEIRSKLSDHGEMKLKLMKMESMQTDSEGLKARMGKQEEQLKTLKSTNESITAELSGLEVKLAHEQALKKKLEE